MEEILLCDSGQLKYECHFCLILISVSEIQAINIKSLYLSVEVYMFSTEVLFGDTLNL